MWTTYSQGVNDIIITSSNHQHIAESPKQQLDFTKISLIPMPSIHTMQLYPFSFMYNQEPIKSIIDFAYSLQKKYKFWMNSSDALQKISSKDRLKFLTACPKVRRQWEEGGFEIWEKNQSLLKASTSKANHLPKAPNNNTESKGQRLAKLGGSRILTSDLMQVCSPSTNQCSPSATNPFYWFISFYSPLLF